MKFTVFTPTFNRKNTLHRVYDSLCLQTLQDFEWLIVDDGSDDGTRGLVDGWVLDNKITINYHYQTNKGKPSALNKGIALAKGDLFACLDSDDAIVPNALSRLWEAWLTVVDNGDVKTITCMCMTQNSLVINDPKISNLTIVNPIDMFFFQPGERWGCHALYALKEFTFPIFPGEKFIPEGVVWLSFAENYDAVWVNDALRVYYDSDDSLSSRASSLRRSNPNGYLVHYATLLRVAPTIIYKIKGLFKLAAFIIFHLLLKFRSKS